MFEFNQGTGFDWDQGNSDKNWIKHGVSREECEEIFRNRPLVGELEISDSEERYPALGETNGGRRLFVVYTVRRELIRVISARDMSRRERRTYRRG